MLMPYIIHYLIIIMNNLEFLKNNIFKKHKTENKNFFVFFKIKLNHLKIVIKLIKNKLFNLIINFFKCKILPNSNNCVFVIYLAGRILKFITDLNYLLVNSLIGKH